MIAANQNTFETEIGKDMRRKMQICGDPMRHRSGAVLPISIAKGRLLDMIAW